MNFFQGAQTVLHCATDASLSDENGLLYRDCKVYKSKKELSPEIGLRLWETSAKLVGLREDLNESGADSRNDNLP